MANSQTIRQTTSVAAGVTSPNIIQGTLIQYPGAASMVRVAATVPAAGAGVVFGTLKLGGRVVAPEQVLPTESSVGRGPDAMLGWLISAPARGDDLLELTFRNGGGATHVITSLVNVEPV